MTNSIEWIEKLSSQRMELEEIGRRLGIHPLVLEDCFHRNQRAKFDDFENQQLLVWFLVAQDKVYELEFVIFPSAVLLVTLDPPPRGKTWWECLRLTPGARDSWHLLYQAIDHAVDLTSEEIRPAFAAIDQFEQKLFHETTDPRVLLTLKRKLAHWEFALAPLPSVVGQLQRSLNPKDDLRWRLRDLHDHSVRVHQSIVFSLGQVSSAMEMYWGFTAKRTNDRMKKLTLLASVAVPMTFWSSFWGMNFTAIPFENRLLFWGALAIMAVSGLGLYLTLRRKGYWEKD